MNRIVRFGTNIFFLIGLFANAQDIMWTGSSNNNDFFDEGNWKNSITNIVPASGTIDSGKAINLPLKINNIATAISASGTINLGTGSLVVGSANLMATSLSGGNVIINEDGYVDLNSATPFQNNVQINFTSGIGWIKTINYNPTAISTSNLGQIKVNSSVAVNQTNLRLNHYYEKGCVIRANLASTTPLSVYDATNLGGNSGLITVNTIHSDNEIANAMNNKIESFILKKGFMVTFANDLDGTGKSSNYIASENDLIINTLPRTLQNSISFIRVMPWNWVTKKGFNALLDSNLNATWRYQWNPNDPSTLEHEFAPMTWGGSNADDATDIGNLVAKYNTTHVMSFNEPDNCNDQSGQYGNPKLCTIDQAVKLHKNLMKTGIRIVSPGGREEAPFGWLQQFYDAAKAQDVRIDVIAVHWYDWGNNPTVNTNPTGDDVFNRFKAYLTNVHNRFGLPVWITEFNANPARSQAVNARFLELALPYLETLDYIERYCWFPFNTGTHFTTGWDEVNRVPTNTELSLVGTIYKNIKNSTPEQSTPSIPEATVNSGNSLNLSDFPNIALNKTATASSTYLTNIPANAVDGDKTNTTSRWLVNFGVSGTDNYSPLPAWLEIDLQGSFLVDSFRIFEMSNGVKNFRFEVWDSTLNSGNGGWLIAESFTNLTSTLTTYKTITPVSTTKVRLYITSHFDTGYLRMFELEVYGTPSSPTWIGATNSNWNTATNWSTSIVPNQFSNVTIPSGTPFQPIISSSQSMKTLTITTGASVTVATGVNVTVLDAIRNAGTMTIANNSNLLQDDAFNNTGNIIINRNSSALSRLDYTIWSSPVTNPNQFLTTFSPATSLNRFYNYDERNNVFTVIPSPSTAIFAPATGYLIRMPNTAVTAPNTQFYNGVFTGVPNNGVIRKVITYRWTNYGYNMIGNPYPSTIDANLFIDRNKSRIESTIYFWRKKNAVGGTAYATYNLTGSVGVASGTSTIPNGKIQVGQGFFVKSKNTTNLFVDFENSMRLGNTSTQFFRTKQEQKDRIWLNLTNTSGVFSQALIGYVPNATLGVDDFDGRYINDSPLALTSLINDDEYTIQGRPTFDPSDAVALNFKTDVAGEYTIAIDHFDGVFANGQEVYLVDSKTGVETDLKSGGYTFNALAEIDNKRFSLKYEKTLKVVAKDFNENNIKVYKNNGTLYVKSGTIAINNIKVYDVQGRLIAEQNNVKTRTASINNLKVVHQVLIVQITGEDNNVVTKKVIN